jgi:Tol biopolymer transport system component
MTHLWLIDAADEKAKPEALTTGADFSIGGFSWSPDSKRIAFSATRDPDLSNSSTSDIYVVRISDKYVKKLVDAPGPDRNPVWSPDGTEIAYESGREFSFLNSRIAVVPSDGGKSRLLTEGFDETARIVTWAASGLYFDAQQRTASHLFRLIPATGKFERISAPADYQVGSPSFTSDFSRAAFTCAGAESIHRNLHLAAQRFRAQRRLPT